MDDPDLLTQDEAAAALRMSRRTLQRYRNDGKGPAITRVGPRRVMFRRADLDAWLASNREARA